MSDQKEVEWQCAPCSKKYTNYSSYYVHMRNKHKEETRIRDSGNYKLKFTQQQLNDLEDKIYVFLGQLGDGNPDVADRSQNNLSEEGNRQLGNNYLSNFVVRTPYQPQIVVTEETIQIGGKKQWEQKLLKMKKQVISFYNRLMEEREKWQYMDPLDTDQDPDEEFSLMDISKLVKNLHRRQIKLQFQEFTIFILWLSRVCKPQAWIQIYQAAAYCLCQFYQYLISNHFPKTVISWVSYVATRKPEIVQKYQYKAQNMIISHYNIEKILQLYYKWAQYFGVFPKKEIVT